MDGTAGVICVLGDAHLDVVVAVSEPVAPDTDTPASIRLALGGQAANVAAWVVALGGQSRLIAARANDLAAGLVAAELASRGVGFVGPGINGATGVIVSLSAGGGQRSMLTDGPVDTEQVRERRLAARLITGCRGQDLVGPVAAGQALRHRVRGLDVPAEHHGEGPAEVTGHPVRDPGRRGR